MDILNKLLKWIDHNRYLTIGLILGLALSGYMVGCSAKTRSLLSEDQKVTLRELEREVVVVQQTLAEEAAALNGGEARYNAKVASYNRAIELAEADIEQQEAVRMRLVEIAGALGTAAATGAISPATAVAAAIQALTLAVGIGVGVDNRRKNRIISGLKNGNLSPADSA